MSSGAVVRKERVDLKKEEKWLIREIQFLEEFKEDILEILNLREKVSSFQEAVEQGKSRDLPKKLQLMKGFIEKDEHKFKKFRRVLERGERRRVRYEKRVLGRIATINQSLDEPSKKELEEILEQVTVYSARILTELSWRTGKIEILSSQKTPDLSLIRPHLEATLEASKALVAILERVEKFMGLLENKIHEKKLILPILPKTAGLTGYFREGVIKTAVVKSILPLRYFLEKGLTKKISKKSLFSDEHGPNKFGEKYYQILQDYESELRKVLSAEDLELLKNIDYAVPAESTLLFLPGFRRPILSFNLAFFPNFRTPGWISHAIPGENLQQLSRQGFLTAPLEQVFEKKEYFTIKEGDMTKRLTDGISFSFQECKKYQAYQKTANRSTGKTGQTGGLFIFSMKEILTEGLILDFLGTIDGWPEIVLRDETYGKYSADLVEVLLRTFRQAYAEWLERYDDAHVFFQAAKKNSAFLHQLEEALSGTETMNSVLVGTTVFFAKRFDQLEAGELLRRVSQAKGREFIAKLNKAYEEDSEGELFKKFHAEHIEAEKRIQKEHIQQQAVFSGEGYFYARLSRLHLTKKILQDLLQFLDDDNFLQFSISISSDLGIPYGNEAFLPPLARFARNAMPSYLNETIFQQGLDYLDVSAVRVQNVPGFCLTLTLMKEKPNLFASKVTHSSQDYVQFLNKMSPHQVRKLVVKTRAQVLKALELIIARRFRTKSPCLVDSRKGLLLVNRSNQDEETLRKIANHGTAVFTEFSFDQNGHFLDMELDFFLQEVLPLTSLQRGKELYDKNSYFFVRGGKLVVNLRESDREVAIA